MISKRRFPVVPLSFGTNRSALKTYNAVTRILLLANCLLQFPYSQNQLPNALRSNSREDCSQPVTIPLWRFPSIYSLRSSLSSLPK